MCDEEVGGVTLLKQSTGLNQKQRHFHWKNNEGKQSLHEIIDRERRGRIDRWAMEGSWKGRK